MLFLLQWSKILSQRPQMHRTLCFSCAKKVSSISPKIEGKVTG